MNDPARRKRATLPKRAGLHADSPRSGTRPSRVGVADLGDTIGGYQLLGVIGQGGMGVVMRARDPRLERDVALKLVHPHLAGSEEIVAGIVEEARAMAALQHPNVVTVYAVGHEPGRPFVAMELVEGGSLEDRLMRGPMAIDEAIGALREVAAGLAAIHATGRVHGDVKPSNVLCATDGRVVLTDMGLSRRFGAEVATGGVVRGTPAYLPPERLGDGPTAAPLMLRQDVYALGIMAVELMTGRLPFDHEDPVELARQHLHREPPRPSALSGGALHPAYDGPLMRALRKLPLDRTESPLALVQELEEVHRHLSRPGRVLRVLIADDDADWRQMLALVIVKRFRGAVVETVPDGRTAVEAAHRAKPDIALIDLHMPGLNGIELTHALRELAPSSELPIVVMSGEGNGADWRILRSLGADRFFVKPVVTAELCEVIEKLTARPGCGETPHT